METWILVMTWWAFSSLSPNVVTVPGLPSQEACEKVYAQTVQQVRPWNVSHSCSKVGK